MSTSRFYSLVVIFSRGCRTFFRVMRQDFFRISESCEYPTRARDYISHFHSSPMRADISSSSVKTWGHHRFTEIFVFWTEDAKRVFFVVSTLKMLRNSKKCYSIIHSFTPFYGAIYPWAEGGSDPLNPPSAHAPEYGNMHLYVIIYYSIL